MKNYFLLLCLCLSFQLNAQVDSLQLKKESRFKVASKILKNSFLSVPGDFSEMGKSISKDWKKTATYAGGILGLIAIDKYTTSFLHNHIEPAIDYKIPNIAIGNNTYPWISSNDAYISYPLIGLYAGSIITNSEKGQIAAVNSFKALSYSILISHLIFKAVFARNRPFRRVDSSLPAPEPWTKDPWDFGNFHSIKLNSHAYGTAFPSLHATAFFSIAKVIQMEYDNYWIPYTFMSAVFLADIKGHNHWVSDLVLGGIIGTIIGRSTVLSSRKQIAKANNGLSQRSKNKFKLNKQLIPQVSKNMVGLHFVGSF
ncbi:phosphatase PAP2 family protein [Bacteroidota bacterium]